MLKVGWSSRDFTPPRPAMLQGQFYRRVAKAVADQLTVTALAVEGGGDAAVLVSCDIVGISAATLAGVRDGVSRLAPDIPPEKIVMNATHTHTSIITEEDMFIHPGGGVMTPTECREILIARAVEAAAEAWKSRKARLIGRAFGHAVVGHNRHAVYADGHGEMYGNTARADFRNIAGYEDHSLDMLFVWEPDGALSGIALSIPCPSQVDEHLEVYSADYWHDVRTELRARLGAGLMVLPLCGAAGDQSPHFLVYGRQEEEMRRRRGVSQRREIALRVADAVERALACTGPDLAVEARLAHIVKTVGLEPRRVTQADHDWARAGYDKWVEEHGEGHTMWPLRYKSVIDAFTGAVKREPFPAELHFIRVGDAAIATNPFELYLDYAMRIKALSPAAQTIMVQLAGMGLYLPSERAVAAGGYGAAPFVSPVDPEGGRRLVAETLAALDALFARD